MKLTSNKIFSFMLAAAFALTLAGCGGGGTAAVDPDPGVTGQTDAEKCVADGGRVEDDGSCTSAADIAAEVAAAEAARIAAAAADTKAADTKAAAIDAEVRQLADADIGGSENADSTYGMTISRDRDGTTVKVTDTANRDEADPPNPQFMQAMNLGGGRTMHVRAMEADTDGNVEEEIVIVSTDIAAPVATAFAKVAEQALTVRDLSDAVDANKDGDLNNDFTAISVVTANLAQIMAGGFSASGAGYLSYEPDDDKTMDKDEAFETAGTYNGAAGTYRCDGDAACDLKYDEKGKITEVGKGWVFTPDAGATSDVPDADYLHYGVWLKKTTDKDGATTYNEVETFAGSSVAKSDGKDLDTVMGSASYTGGATGVFVKNVHASDGTIESATSGHFTADASLMVYFGGDDVAVNKQNTVTGSINNFSLSGEEENAWSVALKGGRADEQNTISGTANGGGAEAKFSGTFHGPTDEYDHDKDAKTDMIRRQPHTVVGEFNANFSNGSVAGGYGARK